jgi:deoxyhypusine synthase
MSKKTQKSAKYLSRKIRPYDPSKVNDLDDALIQLQGCSFQGRNLGLALEILTKMVEERECFKVLTLSGALIPAGMEEIICQGIEKKVFNCIVSTGANISHSVINAFEKEDHQSHYIGSDRVDDAELYHQRINRIYDTYVTERSYEETEDELSKILLKKYGNDPNKTITLLPSDLIKEIGDSLPGRSFLTVASKYKVPIFCGASSDSELCLDMLVYRRKKGLKIVLDEIGDIDKFGAIIENNKSHGTIILGGGVPRNWAQQIFPYLDQFYCDIPDKEFKGYKYSVRFHTAVPYDGGLSGCTVQEGVSWGKYDCNADNQSVWGDSTVYFPLIMTALFQRLAKKQKTNH